MSSPPIPAVLAQFAHRKAIETRSWVVLVKAARCAIAALAKATTYAIAALAKATTYASAMMGRSTPAWRGAAAAVVLACFGGQCLAASTPWPEVQFRYFARQYELARVLHDFADTFGLKLELSDKVSGQISGEITATSPTVFLDALSSSYGFDWYYQDGVLYVTKSVEWSSQVLHVGTAGRDV